MRPDGTNVQLPTAIRTSCYSAINEYVYGIFQPVLVGIWPRISQLSPSATKSQYRGDYNRLDAIVLAIQATIRKDPRITFKASELSDLSPWEAWIVYVSHRILSEDVGNQGTHEVNPQNIRTELIKS